jgi:hypothetical protein
VVAEDSFGVAGHEQHLHRWAEGSDPVRGFLSGHLWHDDVDDEQVDAAGVTGGDRDGVASAGGRDHLVAIAGQDAAGRLPQGHLVLDDQHGLAVAALCWLRPRQGLLGGLAGGGQQDGEDGAAAGFGVDVQVAASLGDDAVDGGQAEAEARSVALGLGTEERLERPVDHPPGHPGATVADLQGGVPAGGRPGAAACGQPVYIGVGGADRQSPAGRHGIAGVGGQVDRYPNIRSAAAFTSTIRPPESAHTIASGAVSKSQTNRGSVKCRAELAGS